MAERNEHSVCLCEGKSKTSDSLKQMKQSDREQLCKADFSQDSFAFMRTYVPGKSDTIYLGCITRVGAPVCICARKCAGMGFYG